MDVVDITDKDIRIARQGAASAARSGRNLIELNDLVAEANLWLVEHTDKVALWRDQGRHGQNKLRNACRQRCLTLIANERKRRSGHLNGDVFYYSAQMLREIVPDIFDEDDWTSSSMAASAEIRGPSRPAEGNNRLAMVADVRSAFYSLPDQDQHFLREMYEDGGLPLDMIALRWDITERTVRRREDRIFEKMVERLGGEPPWKN